MHKRVKHVRLCSLEINIDVQKDPKQWILMKVYKGQAFFSLVQDVIGKLRNVKIS